MNTVKKIVKDFIFYVGYATMCFGAIWSVILLANKIYNKYIEKQFDWVDEK